MYNAITRDVERELFPCLRRLGMRFYGYNPLAGGMLTGKHVRYEDDAKDTRYAASAEMNARYRYHFSTSIFCLFSLCCSVQRTSRTCSRLFCSDRYWKPSFFAALEVIRHACDSEGVTMANAAIRWTLHHSLLSGSAGDGIIIGASSTKQLSDNLAVCVCVACELAAMELCVCKGVFFRDLTVVQRWSAL
jgi:aflatoxin B1 aldehyde reductase